MCTLGAAGALLLGLFAHPLFAAPLTPAEIAATCGDADGLAHCGRLIEAVQLKHLPGLASRDGDTLSVTLYPSGQTAFTDSQVSDGGRTYSLWDYLDPVNIAVLYVTKGDDAFFLLLQRVNGRTFDVPAEPKLAPDRQHLVTADFCESRCTNEVTLWRINRDSVRKEARWKPSPRWDDASVRWKSGNVVEIGYTLPGDSTLRTIERALDAPEWSRIAQP